MGRDIHMQVFKRDKNNKLNIFEEEIFDGRNSDWFNNLVGNGWDNEYDFLPTYWGVPEDAPEKYKEIYENRKDNCYFDFRYFRVIDFLNWYNKYKPYLKAGWATRYEEWICRVKNMPLEYLPISKPDDDGDEYTFIEYENKNDCSKWLYEYIKEKELGFEDIIFYYFDC